MSTQSEVDKVREVNTKFYELFRTQSLEGMKELWAEKDYVVFCNPNGRHFHGPDAVAEGWQQIFGAGGRIDIEMTNDKIQVADCLAWVFGDVRYRGQYAPEENRPDDCGPGFGTTNLFEKIDGEWKMIHHMSSGKR